MGLTFGRNGKKDPEVERKIDIIIRHTARPFWLMGMPTRDEELLRERLAKPLQRDSERDQEAV